MSASPAVGSRQPSLHRANCTPIQPRFTISGRFTGVRPGMLEGGESWRAGNPGKKDTREREEKKIRAARATSPGGPGGVEKLKKHEIWGNSAAKNWAPPRGTHGTLYLQPSNICAPRSLGERSVYRESSEFIKRFH